MYIYFNIQYNKEGVQYRITEHIINDLQPVLETYQVTRLARRLADCLLNDSDGECFGARDDKLVEPFMPILLDTVIDTKPSNVKFHRAFIEGKNLSEKTNEFRNLMIRAMEDIPEEALDITKLNEYIEHNRIH